MSKKGGSSAPLNYEPSKHLQTKLNQTRFPESFSGISRYLELLAWDCAQSSFEYLKGWRLHNLSGQHHPVCDHHPQYKSDFLLSDGNSCVLIFAYFLLSWLSQASFPGSIYHLLTWRFSKKIVLCK